MIGCENVGKLPIVNVVINDHVFPLHGEDYVYVETIVDDKRNLCKTAFKGHDTGVILY